MADEEQFDGLDELPSSPSPDTIKVGSTTMSLPTKLKGKKIKKKGHRRENNITGEVTFKKSSSEAIAGALQLGIAHSVGKLSERPERDVLMQDFEVVELIDFPTKGTTLTPPHEFGEFTFQSYAPLAMRYFRDIFDISVEGYIHSIIHEPLTAIGNPGASGSLFWITHDDEFIIKTVDNKEAEFLMNLLPGYFMNVQQNPRTLLPKFYGLYCVKKERKHIRVVVMNNLLPRDVEMHYKFDLKGSRYKRKANSKEQQKKSPTWKDLDFERIFDSKRISLVKESYSAMIETIKRDCLVLNSFSIMDYSFLIGVHKCSVGEIASMESMSLSASNSRGNSGTGSLVKRKKNKKSFHKRSALYSSPMEQVFTGSQVNLQLSQHKVDQNWGGIPAFLPDGTQVLIYCGIIDILQCYKLLKKTEHFFKSLYTNGEEISVVRPGFYAERFQDFLKNKVFIPQSKSSLPNPSQILEQGLEEELEDKLSKEAAKSNVDHNKNGTFF